MKKEYKQKTLGADEPRILVTKEFVEKNKLSINLDNAKEIMNVEDDMFGFGKGVARDILPFEDVKDWLKEEYVKEVEAGKKKWGVITDVYEITQDFLDYMVFAWMKSQDERGLSAGRSIEKLSVWMKILNREDLAEVLNGSYNPYGAPALIECCKKLGIKVPDSLVEFAKNPC